MIVSSASDTAAAAVLDSAFVGSEASYAASSAAMSEGNVGGVGFGGSAYAFTFPTGASFAYESNTIGGGSDRTRELVRK